MTTLKDDKPIPAWMFALTVVGSLSFGLVLFVALPHWVAAWVLGQDVANGFVFNVLEGCIKLVIFIAYLALIGRKPDIRRVFEYHGAEHKVVYAVENGRPLTPEGARPFDTPHPRCGTGFALLTIFVSIVCFSFLPQTESKFIGSIARIASMPIVAGISYELLKLTTNPRWKGLAILLMTPGMWLQRLTTKQPDDSQLEVSCTAMRAVIAAEDQFLAENQAKAAAG
jgi:uncharacterized protein YqhQ